MALSFEELEKKKTELLEKMVEDQLKEEKRGENLSKFLDADEEKTKNIRKKVYEDFVKKELEVSPSLADSVDSLKYLFTKGLELMTDAKPETDKTPEPEKKTDEKEQTERKPGTPHNPQNTETGENLTENQKILKKSLEKMSEVDKKSLANMLEMYGASNAKKRK